MSAKSYFTFLSNLTIVINLFVGVGALYLIERIVPAIEEILNENAYSVSSVLKMQENLVTSNLTSDPESNRLIFWKAFDEAKNNITIEGEDEALLEIESLATKFWKGDQTQRTQLSQKLTELADLNLNSMNLKNAKAKTLGLAGAWALGFLIIFALILQLSLRKKVFSSIIDPTTSLLNVITQYNSGNLQRRFSSSPVTAKEINKTGEVLNHILDENLSFRLK